VLLLCIVFVCVCGGGGKVAILSVRKNVTLLSENTHVYSEVT
jgi:hypothetical protein